MMTRDELDQLGVTCSVTEAARALSVSTAHAYRSIEKGTFPVRVLQVESRISIPTADLRAYLLGDTAPQPDMLDRLDQLISVQRETVRLLAILASASIPIPA